MALPSASAPVFLALACALAACNVHTEFHSSLPGRGSPTPGPTKPPTAPAPGDEEPASKPASATATASAAPAVASAPAAPAVPAVPFSNKPDAPGPAYLVINGHLAILDAGKVTMVEELSSYVSDLKLGPDGAVWVAGSSLYRVSQGAAEKQGRQYTVDVAVGADGVVWQLTGDALTSTTTDDKTATMALPTGERARFVGVSGKGEVFVAGTKQIYQRQGADWKEIKAPKVFGAEPSFHGFVSGPKGELFAFSLMGVGKLGDDGAWAKVALPSNLLPKLGSVSAAGVLSTVDGDDMLIVAPGAKAEKKSIKTLKFAAETLSGAAVDGQGRRWISTDGGLAILSAKGQLLQHWPPGSLPGPISRFLLVGAGPVLPDAPPEVIKGTMTGKLISSGAAVTSSPIEICSIPSLLMIGGDTPCKHNAVRFSGKTDASGVFSFPGVPRQPYGLAYKNGKKWSVVLGTAGCCAQMAQGETIDLGEVRLGK